MYVHSHFFNFLFIISLELFEKVYTVFTLDLTPDHCNNFQIHPPQSGNISLEVTPPLKIEKKFENTNCYLVDFNAVSIVLIVK